MQQTSQFNFVLQVLKGWKELIESIKEQRIQLMLFQSRCDHRSQKSIFVGWKRYQKKHKKFNKRRDLFYTKILIFNYRFILSKYFTAMKQHQKHLVTEYYLKEELKKVRSQFITKKKHTIFKRFQLYNHLMKQRKNLMILQKQKWFEKWNMSLKFQKNQKRLEQKQRHKPKQDQENQIQNNSQGPLPVNINELDNWIESKKAQRIEPKVRSNKLIIDVELSKNQILNDSQPTKTLAFKDSRLEVPKQDPQKQDLPKQNLPKQELPKLDQTQLLKQLDSFSLNLQQKMDELEFLKSQDNYGTMKHLQITLKSDIKSLVQQIQEVKIEINCA